MTESSSMAAVSSLHTRHPRLFREFRFVYPVLSRRSHGISVGINLNPDGACNFRCVYCQVDRDGLKETGRGSGKVVEAVVEQELRHLLASISDGSLFEDSRFRGLPPELKRLNDIALSGDGEPTSSPLFPGILKLAADVRGQMGLDEAKIVLLTNASLLHRPRVRQALCSIESGTLEVWAKLDAGTEAYFRKISRSRVSFSRIVDNITSTARTRPVVIQSLFLRLAGVAPPPEEIEAYCNVLKSVREAGGQLQLVQLYTIARTPSEPFASALGNAEIDAICRVVRSRLEGVQVDAYYTPLPS